ncbi:MAG: deoxyribonuclease [Solirubrobacterales bacterium]|jgi:deoxyribonuclease-4|nr:deoxyribonuclease [Solirubrobacterales bacterium]
MAIPPVGAHIWGEDPLAEAESIGAELVQLFLSNPQGWEKPPPRDDVEELKAADLGIYVHAPYLINVCSPKPNIRYGSRKILKQTCEAAAEIGAIAVIVHPGHAEDGIDEGVSRWTRTLEQVESEIPIYLENTAGGDNAVARRFDALAKLWDAVGLAKTKNEIGFCFDTCHAHAAGEDLSDAVERAIEITGGIDLMHVNDSRDKAGTGADRHTTIGEGHIDLDDLRHMIAAANAPTVVETPREIDLLKADMAFVREALEA